MSYKHDELIFNYIKDNPGYDAKQIAGILEISESSTKVAVNRLIESELVCRYKRKLRLTSTAKEYVEYIPKNITKEKPAIKTPNIFLNKDSLEDFGDIISLGQLALKIEQSGRQINTSTVPYTQITFNKLITQIKEASLKSLSDEQFILYHRMLLLNQLVVGNFEFFSLLPQAEYPKEGTVKSVLNTFNP